ncbi:MAG: tetratricopeptide repeat-containing sulfotransferase family protein [bacterium]
MPKQAGEGSEFFQRGLQAAEHNDWLRALDFFLQAQAAGLDSIQLNRVLALSYLNVGDPVEAYQRFHMLFQADPSDVWVLARIAEASDRLSPQSDEVMAMLQLLQSDRCAPSDQIVLNFSLGKVFHRASDYQRAMAHYAQGNSLRALSSRFNADRWTAHVDQLIQVYSRQLVQRLSGVCVSDARPVFVVGPPRSGKSLVEHLLASVPGAVAGGEIQYLPTQGILDIEKALSEKGRYPECMRAFEQRHAELIAQRYLVQIQPLMSETTRHVTDTMPFNMLTGGLIASVFPKARIIFCSRDRNDLALEIFFKLFESGNDFSYRQEDIANYLWNYERLKTHWLQTLSIEMLEVNYEDLVSSPGQAMARFADFLEVEKQAIDNQHTYSGSVIHTDSVGMAEPYQLQLLPFKSQYLDLLDS